MNQKLNLSWILGVVLFFIFQVATAGPEKPGLYLSFEERLAASWALSLHGEEPEKATELKRLVLPYIASLVEAGMQETQVQNFQEFLRLYRGEWPNTNSLFEDVRIILSGPARPYQTFKAQSPRVQRQIDNYLNERYEKMKALLLPAQDNSPTGVNLLKALQSYDHTQFVESQLDRLGQVGDKVSETAFAGVASDATRISMTVILQEYFSRMGLASKKMILSSFLGDDLLSSDMRKFEMMVQNSGPQFQKLLQVLTRMTGIPDHLAAVFKVLESSVKQVPWVQVQRILERERGNFKFIYFDREPLGVGTMAQVHRAKLDINGKKTSVVVRFIKPGIEDRVAEDERILFEAAQILDARPDYRKTGAPPLSPVIKDLTGTVMAELSQTDTMERQLIASGPYTRKMEISVGNNKKIQLNIHVPKIYPAPNAESELMVQEMIFGKKLDKEADLYKDTMPELKKAVVETMVKTWAQEVFFGSGFFHSDLHQGNFLLRVQNGEAFLNILDFGMGGRLSKDLQAHVLLFGVAATLLDPKLLAMAISKISDSELLVSDAELESRIRAQIAASKKGGEAPWKLSDWAGWAVDQGLKLPFEFVNLNRGMTIMDTLLEDANSKLTMSEIIKDLALANPKDVLHRLLKVERVRKRDLLRASWNRATEAMKSYSQRLFRPKNTTALLPQVGSPASASALQCGAVFN